MARLADVVEYGRATKLASVINDEIAEAQEPLGNAGRNCDVLDLAEWDVSRRSGDEARINLDLRIRERVTYRVSPQMKVGGNQQQ